MAGFGRLLSFAGGVFLITQAMPVLADPAGELAKFSVFDRVDLDKLAAKPLTARGPALPSPQDLAVQALYVVRAPLPQTYELHRQWDPGKHPELKVRLHREIGAKPGPGDFSALEAAPKNGAVRALGAATLKLPQAPELQLSEAEAKLFKPAGGGGTGGLPAAASDFWKRILQQRAAAFSSSGLAGQPPYSREGKSAAVAEEAARLLKEQPKIREQFRSLIEQSPLQGGGARGGRLYWELFEVEGKGAVSLGAGYGKSAADSAQLLDLLYYASDGYYVYFTLYQMWPVTVGGRPATLVWRGDSLSSAALSALRGMERMGSGAAMMQEIQKMTTILQKEGSQ